MDEDKLHGICRACMCTDGEMKPIILSTPEDVTPGLANMMMSLTSVNITNMDGLPNQICISCELSLQAAFIFKQQCERSDSELRKHYGEGFLTRSAQQDIKSEPQHDALDFLLLKPKIEMDIDLETDQDTETFPDPDSDPVEGIKLKIEKERLTDIYHTKIPGKRGRKKLNKIYPCNICGKQFDKAYRLQRHLNIHNTIGKPYECAECWQRFAREDLLIRHKIKHSELMISTISSNDENREQVYKCSDCDREFPKQESLSAHMQKHKNLSQTRFDCELCDKSFAKASHLSRHSKTHGAVKAHQCQLCPKSFALGGQLIDHMNKHNGVKPHVCPVCAKGCDIP